MSVRSSVVVTFDGQVQDPGQPLLFADDLAALRGDGIFETILVRAGRACLVEAHLERFSRSAAIMDLPEPDLPGWRRAIETAVGLWSSAGPDEGVLRLVCSRGREQGTAPTGYLTVNPIPARALAARRDGIAALILDRGLAAGGAEAMPWLLAGAKTLSYAINMAALRHAARQGADDVIFLSTDGFILEGPRSTVVIATEGDSGRTRFLTPPPDHPILRGTTQQALFEVAPDCGFVCAYRALRTEDLFAAQGVWLVSSMTLAAHVRNLAGLPLPDTALAAEFARLVDAAVMSENRLSPSR